MARHVPTPDCSPNCFGCKIQSVSMAASAMPTRSNAGMIESSTKVMHKDVAAYKRLRKDGLQPKTVKGSANLESRAVSKWEIQTNTSLGGDAKLGAKFDAAQAILGTN